MVNDSLRAFIVSTFSTFVLGWQCFQLLQLVGFVIMIIAVVIFNNVRSIGKPILDPRPTKGFYFYMT